jgi:acrylyl-CoA reductase (NADPH)
MSRPVVVVTGGVGSAAIAILRHRGFQVTAVTGRPEQANHLKGLGGHRHHRRNEPPKPLGKARWAGDRLDHARSCAFDDALRRGGGGLWTGGRHGFADFGRVRGASRLGIGSVMRRWQMGEWRDNGWRATSIGESLRP